MDTTASPPLARRTAACLCRSCRPVAPLRLVLVGAARSGVLPLQLLQPSPVAGKTRQAPGLLQLLRLLQPLQLLKLRSFVD